MKIPFLRPKKEKNINKIKKLNSNELAKLMGDEVYLIFRYSLTKKEFVEKLEKWLNSEAEERSKDQNHEIYDYNIRGL